MLGVKFLVKIGRLDHFSGRSPFRLEAPSPPKKCQEAVGVHQRRAINAMSPPLQKQLRRVPELDHYSDDLVIDEHAPWLERSHALALFRKEFTTVYCKSVLDPCEDVLWLGKHVHTGDLSIEI